MGGTHRGLLDLRLNWCHGIYIKRVTGPEVELVLLDAHTQRVTGPKAELVQYDTLSLDLRLNWCSMIHCLCT